MKDLIKENATYKLFLIELLESFDNNYKESKDKELKRYFKELSTTIEQVLNITDRHSKVDKETLDNLFKSEVE
jgi:hypothetical protein